MATERSGETFFERAVTIHRFDCHAVSGEAGDASFEASEDAVEALMPGGEAVRYGLESRPVYDGLRRLAGHLAGLLILVETGGGRKVLELPDLRAARDRLAELTGELSRLNAPERLRPHRERLVEARRLAAEVLRQFERLGGAGESEGPRDAATRRLKDLCAVLKSASEPRIGLSMVDLRHACCNCQPR